MTLTTNIEDHPWEDMNFDLLQPPEWLVKQQGLKDYLGPVNPSALLDAVGKETDKSAVDEDGKVHMGEVNALRPARAKGGKNVVRFETPGGKKLKRCTKCGQTKPIDQFDPHSGSADKHQAYCKKCKSDLNRLRRDNSPVARLKHHIASRCIKQIRDSTGKDAPSDLTTNLEQYLGYTMNELVHHLDADIRERESISIETSFTRGYHMDHRHPLSKYKPLAPGDEEFRKCWALANLWMIPGVDNLKKGSRVDFDRPE